MAHCILWIMVLYKDQKNLNSVSGYLQLYHPSLWSWATPIVFTKMDVPAISTSLSGTHDSKQVLLITSL